MTTTAPTTSREDNVMRLRDGRALGYAEYGDPNGVPLFYFHGTPGSRYAGAALDEAAAGQGVRVISPDRPGCGLSDFQPGRTLSSWPGDIVQLADVAGLSRFAVAGMSGGGPYAAACARHIAIRLSFAIILSGGSPIDAPGAKEGMMRINRIGFGMARRLPFLLDLAMKLIARRARRHPEKAIEPAKKQMSAPDQRILERPEIEAWMERDFVEAFRRGSRGVAHDIGLVARPWDFRLEEISMRVHLWQGEKDRNAPPSMGRYQAAAIPDCEARFFPGEGHLLIMDHLDELMSLVREHA